ncbi:hypothetical protein [Stieleria tagensis]|uniref:hypothetical protein n=1 Tax=Stieleria tagensis TaxID=2956795 RepID=UPI00209A774C|nr:hypothetical protein [Stieleria tagensis]
MKQPPFNQFFNVLYAGLSATSIQARFVKHCQMPDEGIQNAKSCYGFVTNQMTFYFALASAVEVADLENRLIDCFGPSCNKQAGISPVITAVVGEGKPAG